VLELGLGMVSLVHPITKTKLTLILSSNANPNPNLFHPTTLWMAMGKMRNCSIQNAEGKMWNGMCGATVIQRNFRYEN